jgi:nitrite reductase/ring-hydroxylating ferredoxin subunit
MRHEFVPAFDRSRLDHVGTYKRQVPVSLDRMYENALDWAHLSHLHASSFQDIECLDAGSWGWRAAVIDRRDRRMELELRLDRSARRWITRNLSGPSEGAEIWTHVFIVEERLLDLVIDFFVPGVALEAREKVGRAYAQSYETLYDEDVWMMSERQHQLDRRLDSIDRRAEASVSVANAELPMRVALSGRDFLLNRVAGRWVVYPAQCPHQLGPLDELPLDEGRVQCPWHGFTFDVVTGERTDGGAHGGQCRFGEVPRLGVDGETVTLRW